MNELLAEKPEHKLQAIMELICEDGQTDGDHHKLWVIDQVARIIQGEQYDDWVLDYSYGEDGPETYYWDTGIAP